MQIRATVSPGELQEATRLSRPRSFWLRFFAANWYVSALTLLIIGVGINALVHHEHPKWGGMAIVLAICAFFLGFSWYRYNARLSNIASTSRALAGTLSLDTDGIRTILASGASTFVPWSSYNKWTEGEKVFVLNGKDGTAILPIDNGNREYIRGLLVNKIS